MSVPERYAVAVNSIHIDDGAAGTLECTQYQQHLYHHPKNGFGSTMQGEEQFIMQQSMISIKLEDFKEIEISHNKAINTAENRDVLLDAQMMQREPTTVTVMAHTESDSSLAVNSDGSQREKPQSEWEIISNEGGRYSTPGAAGLEYQKYTQEQAQSSNYNNSNNEDQNMESSAQGENYNKSSNNVNVEDEHLKMSTDELYNLLKEYVILQDKYHTVLLLPKESKREVTAGGRDGSAYVLRCLKIWYELPSDVLFSAMSLVDRFLDRMTVRPKHMACMSVASFYLAIKQLNLKSVPADDLVTISQCGCTAGDLERMANVIANKLGVHMGHSPVTSVTCLRIYYSLFHHLARDIGGEFYEFYQQFIKLEELENRLEVLLCDVRTTTVAPSTLALVLVSLHLDFHIKASYTLGRPELKLVFEYILFLQKFINVADRVFTCGFSVVSDILTHYNGQNKQPYKQRLVWKLSSRTLRLLRPTNRFSSVLPTIQEGITNTIDEGCRLRTDSSSSEEEEDWPTSPIIPIFEQC